MPFDDSLDIHPGEIKWIPSVVDNRGNWTRIADLTAKELAERITDYQLQNRFQHKWHLSLTHDTSNKKKLLLLTKPRGVK